MNNIVYDIVVHQIMIPIENVRLVRFKLSLAELSHNTIVPYVQIVSPSDINVDSIYTDSDYRIEIQLKCVSKNSQYVGFIVEYGEGVSDGQTYDNSIWIDVLRA